MTIKVKPDPDISAEAYAWLAQIETGDMNAADKRALREWMARSPAHEAELRAAATLSAELSALTDLNEALTAEVKAHAHRPVWRLAIAPAGAFAGLIAIGIAIYAMLLAPQNMHALYATQVGEYKTVELADGSLVKLNTNSMLEVTYTRRERTVRLAKGEAFFDVAKNPARPFTVSAGANRARAVGTAFSVRLYDNKTELIVTEGVVAFSDIEIADAAPKSADEGQPVLVKAGYEATSGAINESNALKLTPALQKRKLSWTEGLFDFSDTPLSEVVSEVNRHTAMRIEIADPALKDVQFGGIFRIGDVDTLLDTLPRVGVRVERINNGEVRLYSENS